jgi:polyphosphate kinase
VPRVLPRVIRMPAKVSDGQKLFVALSSVIRAHLELFPGREVGQFSQFRVTRHSDLAVDEEDVRNLRTALRQGLQHRHYGQAVRLEVSAGCSESVASSCWRSSTCRRGAVPRARAGQPGAADSS